MKGLPLVLIVASMLVPAIARADCLDDAARFHHVSPQLLHAIAEQESGMRANAVNRNRNGSEDIGLMQINTSWLPTLARFGIRRASLLDACVNAYVGAWILASNIQAFGANWRAVGAYNAVSPSKQMVYANAIYRRLLRQGH